MGYNKMMHMANNTKYMLRRRNKFRRRYPLTNKFVTWGGKILNLQRQVRFMKGMINSERHYTDIDAGGTPNNAGYITLINEIAQGDDVANRQGNSLLHKYVKINYACTINGSATETFVRIIVFTDTANQGSTPSVTSVITTASVVAQKNVDNQKRFVILKDIKFWLNAANKTQTIGKIYIPTNYHCRYSGSSGTDVLQNAIYILVISNEATNAPVFVSQARNAFYDN